MIGDDTARRAPLRCCALGASLLMLLMTACTTNPATGRRQLLLLTTEQEIALGDGSKEELITEYGGRVQSPQLASYVTGVGNALASHTEADYAQLPWEFIVVDSEVINAFALPGGKVFISRGLLQRLGSEAQMAGVLGHEIGHVTAQHIDERISQAMLLDFGVALVGSLTDSELAAYGASLFSNGYQLKFGRDQEAEADKQGVKYMTAAGYAPQEMLAVLQVLAEASNGPRPPEFLSTHPYPETRIKTVQGLLAGPYKFAVESPDYRDFRDRYERQALPYVSP